MKTVKIPIKYAPGPELQTTALHLYPLLFQAAGNGVNFSMNYSQADEYVKTCYRLMRDAGRQLQDAGIISQMIEANKIFTFKLAPIINLEPLDFVYIPLEVWYKLKSSNARRLYFHAQRFTGSGVIRANIEAMQTKIAGENKYAGNPGMFKRRILEPAIKEINQAETRYKLEIKQFNKVAVIALNAPATIHQDDIRKNLFSIGLTDAQINNTFASYKPETIQQAFFHLQIARTNHQIKTSPAPYFLGIIKNL